MCNSERNNRNVLYETVGLSETRHISETLRQENSVDVYIQLFGCHSRVAYRNDMNLKKGFR